MTSLSLLVGTTLDVLLIQFGVICWIVTNVYIALITKLPLELNIFLTKTETRAKIWYQ